MIQFPKDLENFLLAYVKREFYRGTRRAAFAERPFIDEDLRFFSKGVGELSELFTSERAELKAGYLNRPELRAAYLLYFLPINFAKGLDVLGRLPEEFWRRDSYRVIDLGCGPGSVSLAFAELLLQKNPRAKVEFTLVEQNPAVLQDAQNFLRFRLPQAQIKPIKAWLHAFHFNGEYDLILMSHVLNELTKLGAQQRAEWLLPNLQRHLADQGLLAILEPALKRPTRELMALRDHLLESGGFTVLAPCLHDQRCPMLAATLQDWCHFYVDWKEPEYLQKLDKMVKNDNRFVKVAYLILAQAEAFASNRREKLYRVVSNRMATRGKTEAVLCGQGGRMTLTRLDKERTESNRGIDDIRRGDLVEIKDYRGKGFEVTRQIRADKKFSIKKV
ncbi:MAG TPA: small ribosomal subunit Rsm22 family protein [bacterium]|nr:small ribosomal subunit Rsm22 family protein [bacterium]